MFNVVSVSVSMLVCQYLPYTARKNVCLTSLCFCLFQCFRVGNMLLPHMFPLCVKKICIYTFSNFRRLSSTLRQRA